MKMMYIDVLHFILQGGGAVSNGASMELQAELDAAYTELEKTKADAKHAQEEVERLLSLVEMTQGEQNEKEKVIHELQE